MPEHAWKPHPPPPHTHTLRLFRHSRIANTLQAESPRSELFPPTALNHAQGHTVLVTMSPLTLRHVPSNMPSSSFLSSPSSPRFPLHPAPPPPFAAAVMRARTDPGAASTGRCRRISWRPVTTTKRSLTTTRGQSSGRLPLAASSG